MARDPGSAVERAMKVQEVVLRVIDGRISWVQAAEILRLSPRQVRRWRERLEADGYDGLFDWTLVIRPRPALVPRCRISCARPGAPRSKAPPLL